MSPTDKVAKALLVETKLTGNLDFPTPDPTLLELKAGREKLETAISDAAGGDHAKIFARNLAEASLDDLLFRMALYVTNTAAGNELKILSTGFELRKQPEPLGPLDAPTELEASTGAKPGEIDLRCKPTKGVLLPGADQRFGSRCAGQLDAARAHFARQLGGHSPRSRQALLVPYVRARCRRRQPVQRSSKGL